MHCKQTRHFLLRIGDKQAVIRVARVTRAGLEVRRCAFHVLDVGYCPVIIKNTNGDNGQAVFLFMRYFVPKPVVGHFAFDAYSLF